MGELKGQMSFDLDFLEMLEEDKAFKEQYFKDEMEEGIKNKTP